MKIFLIGLFVIITTVFGYSEDNSNGNTKSALARITFYYPGEDSWGYKTATGVRLKPWAHCAVNPVLIPYNSNVSIPELDLKVKAVDCGASVISRKAAKQDGKNYEERHALVVDIPVASKAEYAEWEKKPALYTIIFWN